jgi:hypothetical protein
MAMSEFTSQMKPAPKLQKESTSSKNENRHGLHLKPPQSHLLGLDSESPDTEEEYSDREEEYKASLNAQVHQNLTKEGYNPPRPPPFVIFRQLAKCTLDEKDSDNLKLIKEIEHEFYDEHGSAFKFIDELSRQIKDPSLQSIVTRAQMFIGRVHKGIDKASISILAPTVAPALQVRMQRYEIFCAGTWSESDHRAILSVHVDTEAKNTIFQLCTAEHGPIYITVPGVLSPEEVANRSIDALLRRLSGFAQFVDPLAVVNGAHQSLNYNYIFADSRVIRAPSGNLERLTENLMVTSTRDRLSAENTAIINSAPKTEDEYRRVFPADETATHFGAWEGEAEQWEALVRGNGFDVSAEASRQQLIEALTQKENVIVLVAHCDGKQFFMPQPPPKGSIVTTEYIREYKSAIAANRPFVYLFSCEAGRVDKLENFASVLLECGASGVVASQSILGAAEGRMFLDRITQERRGTPPIEDAWTAMSETDFREMEIFLA